MNFIWLLKKNKKGIDEFHLVAEEKQPGDSIESMAEERYQHDSGAATSTHLQEQKRSPQPIAKLPVCMASRKRSKPNPEIKENENLASIKEIMRLQMIQQ